MSRGLTVAMVIQRCGLPLTPDAARAAATTGGVVSHESAVLHQGRSMRVDLAHRRLRIVLEADSFEWHGGRAALRRDWGVIADVVARGNRVEA